jgi:hypothetical protein
MTTSDYEKMYTELLNRITSLWSQRADLEGQLGDINKEIESVQNTLQHLAPLAGYISESEQVKALGITENVRSVLDRKARMSAAEVIAKMQERGFDFSKYSAPDATVRTILNRLVEAGKAELEKEGYKTFYRYRPTDDEIPF